MLVGERTRSRPSVALLAVQVASRPVPDRTVTARSRTTPAGSPARATFPGGDPAGPDGGVFGRGQWEWRDDSDRLHRDGDLPAIMVPADRSQHPGLMRWYQHGRLHRDGDRPAIVYPDTDRLFPGRHEWYRHGLAHRDGDRPAIMVGPTSWDGDGYHWTWKQHGMTHRGGDRPALISDSGLEWWVHNLMHRAHAPAVVYRDPNGQLAEHWFWHGYEATPEETELLTVAYTQPVSVADARALAAVLPWTVHVLTDRFQNAGHRHGPVELPARVLTWLQLSTSLTSPD